MKKIFSILLFLTISISVFPQKTIKVYDLGSFSQNRCAFKINDKWGFFDLDGNIVVDPIYVASKPQPPLFSFNRATMRKKNTNNDFVWGCIDTNGVEVIPFIYQGVSQFMDSLGFVYTPASAKDGTTIAHQSIIHISGIRLFENPPLDYDYNTYYKDGMARVRQKGKYGFINYLNMSIIPLKYYDVADFSEGLAPVIIDRKWGYVNTLGILVVDYISQMEPLPFSNKRAFIKDFGPKYGIINNEGKILVEPKYQEAYSFREGVAAVIEDDKNLVSIIDTNLNVVKQWDYRKDRDNFITIISRLEDGLFLARKYDGGKLGYIDKKGNTILPFEYETAEVFSCGRALVKKHNPKTNNYEYGFIDKKGKFVIYIQN